MADQRPSWDEYFMNIANVVATRSTCDRGRMGCLVARNKQILSTGYAGSPIGVAHCDDVGHELHTVINEDGSESKHCIRTTHAEQNAITQAARLGIKLDGATMYTKAVPCYICAKIIINAGIKRIVSSKDYHSSKRSKEVLKEAGVLLEVLKNEVEEYPAQ